MDIWLLKIFIILIITLGISLLIRHFIMFVTQVSSHSMVPTLHSNDRLLTLRVHHHNKLKGGDIIVFYSHEKNIMMIKRLIGLPGDNVQINSEGDLLIDGIKQEEAYVKNKGGKGGSFMVPKGEYLVLGDNRAGSNDSRHWIKATIPAKDIQGKIIHSLNPLRKL